MDIGLRGDKCNFAKCMVERELTVGGSKNALVHDSPERNEGEKMASLNKVAQDANEKNTEIDGDDSIVASEYKKENKEINHCTEHSLIHEAMRVKNNREKKEHGLLDFAGKVNLNSLTKATNTDQVGWKHDDFELNLWDDGVMRYILSHFFYPSMMSKFRTAKQKAVESRVDRHMSKVYSF